MRMCTGVNVNARTNLFPPQNTINDRTMDAVCNKDTILRHPSSQDFCGPHISGATSGHTPFTICCATQQTLLCLNIDSFRRPHQRQKHTIPTHPLPPAGIKNRRTFRVPSEDASREALMCFDAMCLTSKEIAADVISNTMLRRTVYFHPLPTKKQKST